MIHAAAVVSYAEVGMTPLEMGVMCVEVRMTPLETGVTHAEMRMSGGEGRMPPHPVGMVQELGLVL